MAKSIGKYEIIRSLGSGAMGEVYLAHHPAIGREVAIKTILPGAAKGEDAEGRFRREAEAAGKLSHPNLVTIFDFDKDQDVLYLVMEYVRGDDLDDLIKNQSLSSSQFLEVLAQVCDGLSHAHRNGIIHRDVKPANVRVIRDGKNLLAKVMDFGIARMEDSNMTATGIVMGTVSYMAPEYIREGHATTQSDLFAVGVMLYECLTGRKPFAGDNTTTILFKIVSENAAPIDLSTIHGISPSIRNVLDRSLCKDPAERFQTADEFARALRACKDPSWTGTLDEATAMISRHQESLAQAATQPPPLDGTQLLASRTSVEPIPGAQGTTVLPSQPTSAMPALPAPAKAAKSRTGLFAAVAALALAAAGGGAWVTLRPKAPPVPEAAPPVQQAPASAPVAQVPEPAVPGKTETRPEAKPDSRPEPVKVMPAPKAEPAKPEPPKAEPPRVEPPKPAATSAKTLAALVDGDPRQAAAQAKALLAGDPGNAELQGIYLAALYRSKNAWDFERGLSRALASGVTVKKMLGAAPSFRSALAEESRLRKANPPAGVLPEEVMAKILAGL